MKPEEQRIKIAGYLGIQWTKRKTSWDYDEQRSKWADIPIETPISSTVYWFANGVKQIHDIGPPDYLNDLNSMHEAEKMLTDDQHITYRNILANVVGDRSFFCRKYTSATAAQRAEAFLKTLNLWIE